MTDGQTSRPDLGARVAAVTVAGLLLFGVGGCGGDERSVESFCEVWKREATALHDRYEATADAVEADASGLAALGALGDVAGVTTELAIVFTKLEEVAPDDIRVEVAEVRDAMKQQSEATAQLAADPLGTIGGSFFRMLGVSGPLERVDGYISANCGNPPYS